jgi:hypothetical protein
MRKEVFIGFLFSLVGFLLSLVLLSYSSAGQDDWTLRIGVRKTDGHCRDSYNFIGRSNNASLSYDEKDIPESPTSPSGLCLYFPHFDWGVHSGRYATDMRPCLVDNEAYEFVVESSEYTHLTLFWPNIGEVPHEYSFFLIDEEREIFTDMKSEAEYIFICRPEHKNRFRIVVKNRQRI